MNLRDLPSVDELARGSGDPVAVEAARTVIARARQDIRAGADPGDLERRFAEELTAARAPHLRGVINATGVIAHTNLGRAPLAEEALARVVETARGYSNLEYSLAEGREVLVSRGELIEIGDGFRIPDVLARSGARLVEVGTTN